MGTDIKALKSHPNKLLLTHIEGVRNNVKKLTNSHIAELVAIFHDLGKINPNFQAKLNQQSNGNGPYSNHAYLSAYAFFCTFCTTTQGQKLLQSILHIEKITPNDVIALVVLIAKHHSNIPNFMPNVQLGEYGRILSEDENKTLFKFLEHNQDLPISEYVNNYYSIKYVDKYIIEKDVQRCFLQNLVFNNNINDNPLDFFLDTQFSFASVIQADKADASEAGNIIDTQSSEVKEFSKKISINLESFLEKLNQNTELNKLRTTIRNCAVNNIQSALVENECIFELTAPTGSGKTLMLLSLASEIIKAKGAKRIIYALPFLSITEQVETEILKIFKDQTNYIHRVDSKSENKRFDEIQEELDKEITPGKLHELDVLEFQENTFAYPFIITTFVRFFETLLSNKNSELLKLPNFSNCIFLIDEIQALPPRLYGFFTAYIRKFCQKFNSYAIISTATQPNFNLPNSTEVKSFFSDYIRPKSLLPLSYFSNDLFNRYIITYERDHIKLETLKRKIISEETSVLVILNTIDDTKELYETLAEQYDTESNELLLLNTHFTPNDRKQKIEIAKQRLKANQRVIIISTQLIEAGVDIDFPVLYRDFAAVANIVQSAGRCNRNGKLPNFGKVVLFRLEKNGRPRSEIIYQGKDKDILTFTKKAITKNNYQEKELLQVQQTFFKKIQSELNFAHHSQTSSSNIEFDFLKDIKECAFDKIGKFNIIDNQLYGKEYRYYVPKDEDDDMFEQLLEKQDKLISLLKSQHDISTIKNKKREINILLRKMGNNIVQIRIKDKSSKPSLGCDRSYFDLNKIDPLCYSFQRGVEGANFIF